MKKITCAFVLLLGLPILSIGQSLSIHITGNDAKCNGSSTGSASANVIGGVAPYTYNWAPSGGDTANASGLIAGNYTLTVTDHNANMGTASVTINQPSPIVVSIDSIVTQPCFRTMGGVCGCSNSLWAIVNGGTPPYSYFWLPDSNTTDTITDVCYVEFTVKVTDTKGCTVLDSVNILIPPPPPANPEGINTLTNNTSVKVYPVPANNKLNVSINSFSAGNNNLEIYDMMGREVMQQKLDGITSLVSINVGGLINGTYLLRIVGSDSEQITRFSISR